LKTAALDYNYENLKRILELPELNDENQQWLLKFLETTNQPELKQLLWEYFEKDIEKNLGIQKDTSDRLLRKMHDKLAIEQPIKKPTVIKMTSVRMAVASVVMALVVTSIYFLSGKSKPVTLANTSRPAPSTQSHTVEVAPGKDGAILTLSNGTKILLDTLNNGTLAEQQGSKIIKKGTQLIYSGGGANTEVAFNTMSTPRGRQFQLVLADGSMVWLNAASSIRFPTAFTGKDRKVEVTGEVYFEVAKNPSKPFKVMAKGTEIEVLGTHFNIDAYDEVTKTTLLEGSVKINTQNKTSFLKPGQQAQIVAGGEIKTSNSVDVEQVMAWKNGRFVFEDADLQTIMSQVSRWYDVDVVYQDKMPKRSFTADISRNTNLSVFLKVLHVSGIHFKIEGKKLLVQP